MKTLTLTTGILSLALSAWAQISDGGSPPSFESQSAFLKSSDQVEVVKLPSPDRNQLMTEDNARSAKGENYRVAVNLPAQLNTENSGTWETLSNGDRIWRLRIRSKEAIALGLYYSEKIHIPQGGRLYLYNQNRRQVIGAFTSDLNNDVNTIFATEMIEGEEVTLEYYSPAHVTKNPVIEIESVAYFYRSVDEHVYSYMDPSKAQEYQRAQSCEVNVVCSEGSGWQNEIDAVVHYTFSSGGGTYVCSGSMIANTASDCTPYLLTADHCGNKLTTSSLNTNVWYFKYENPNCSPGTTAQYPKPSTTMTGAIFRASSGNGSHQAGNNNQLNGSDFTLVELNSQPPSSYQVYYAGWDRRNTAATSGKGIHHPAGHDKKISTYTSSLSSATYNGGLSGAHWAVVWSATTNGHGVTEGGSSGSPIFDQNHRIVGDLSGGSSFCSTPTSSDLYGKMSVSWDQLSSNANGQLKAWLDPSNTGVQFLDGVRPPCSGGGNQGTCTATISSFPYNEGFESGLGQWTQATGDDLNWTNQTGGTPSSGTGPSAANEGSQYMYIEASSPNYPSKTGQLLSPCFDLSSLNNATLNFSYHMSGAAMGTLRVDVSTDNGTTWTNSAWTINGNQGTAWKDASVDLSAYSGTIRLRFTGITGSSYTSDICIDGLSVSGGGTQPTNCATTISSFPYAESFESGLGQWAQGTGDDLDWTNQTGSTPSSSTGPSAASDGSRYMYVEASSPNYPSKSAYLNSPCFDLSGMSGASLNFAYHMYGSTMGSLSVQVSTNSGTSWSSAIWSLSGDQTNAWKTATVDLSAYAGSTIMIRFNAATGSSWRSDICIDDVSVGSSTPTLTYCTPAPSNGTSDGDYIDGVALGSISNLNSGGTNTAAYKDYTSQSTPLTAGSSQTLTVTEGGYSPDRYAAWIDYNQDGDFADAGEKLGEVTGTAVGSTKQINFTVSSSATNGPTRLRVRCLYNSNSNGVDPCANGDYGETEDYTVVIQSGSKTEMLEATLPMDLHLFPNPTDGMFTLSAVTEGDFEATIVVQDLSGKVLTTTDGELVSGRMEKQMNLSGYAPGVYLVTVNVDGSKLTKRIVLK